MRRAPRWSALANPVPPDASGCAFAPRICHSRRRSLTPLRSAGSPQPARPSTRSSRIPFMSAPIAMPRPVRNGTSMSNAYSGSGYVGRAGRNGACSSGIITNGISTGRSMMPIKCASVPIPGPAPARPALRERGPPCCKAWSAVTTVSGASRRITAEPIRHPDTIALTKESRIAAGAAGFSDSMSATCKSMSPWLNHFRISRNRPLSMHRVRSGTSRSRSRRGTCAVGTERRTGIPRGTGRRGLTAPSIPATAWRHVVTKRNRRNSCVSSNTLHHQRQHPQRAGPGNRTRRAHQGGQRTTPPVRTLYDPRTSPDQRPPQLADLTGRTPSVPEAVAALAVC